MRLKLDQGVAGIPWSIDPASLEQLIPGGKWLKPRFAQNEAIDYIADDGRRIFGLEREANTPIRFGFLSNTLRGFVAKVKVPKDHVQQILDRIVEETGPFGPHQRVSQRTELGEQWNVGFHNERYSISIVISMFKSKVRRLQICVGRPVETSREPAPNKSLQRTA